MTAPRLRLVGSPRPAGPLGLAGLLACSDDELMSLVVAGRRDAFAALVERHGARIANLCTRFVQDPTWGVELAQDTWLEVWAESSRYRADGRFAAWLVTLARNICRNQLRMQHARRRREQQAAPPPSAADNVDQLLARERERQVHGALDRLPESQRAALVLRFADDLRYEQVEHGSAELDRLSLPSQPEESYIRSAGACRCPRQQHARPGRYWPRGTHHNT
ncbi:MAG TPA: sigma-70 family RNA polymerase sigma factor [Polyangiales bacterium]|nr:sigma-70 family RNA polymerase sigma factor [Polyangiales bacterium]